MSLEEFHDLFYIVARAKLRDNIIHSVSNPTTEATSCTQAIEPSSEELPTEPASFVAAEEYFEVCTAYFPSLIRDDLAPEVRQLFDTKLAELLPQTSNFIDDFQVIMFMIMSCFRDHTFTVRNGKSVLDRSNGFQIQSIFPNNFQLQDTLIFSASPYAFNFLTSPDANDIPFLFTDRHVHFLKSGFYDVRGLQTKTKTEYLLRTLLMEAISDSVKQFIQPKNTLHIACYESALTNYVTNLSVMWGGNKMINILLDKFLLVLLRIHLAPTRERKHQESIKSMKNASKERKDKAAKGSKTEADHPTNWFPLLHQSRRRLIVRKERYRLAKYRQKLNRSSSADMKQKWEARAQKSEKRIATYTKALETKELKTASTKKKHPSEPNVAEGSERPRKIPVIQHPSIASAEAGPSMLQTGRMEIDIPTQPYERKGKAPINPQSDPKPVTFQPLMTGETHTIPLAVPEDYASMDENDVVEEEDADDDAPRNRLNGLKGFIKSLLLRDEDLPNEQDLRDLRSDLNEKETEVCLLILRSLKPYIPSKTNYSHIGYQLPFVILANDLLRCAGYAKFCRKICPMPTATQKFFRLDTPSLFKTFCEHGDNKMIFFGYGNRVIRGPLEYINHKDAVLNVFFRINRIQQLCRNRKLIFAHHLHLLPGGKYVRILGIKENSPMKQTADVTGQKRQYNIPESTWQDILNERDKDNETLRQEIDGLLVNTNRLSNKLKDSFKEFSNQDFGLQIKTAKQGWKSPLNLEPEVAVVQGSDSEEEAGACCPQIGECITGAQTQIADIVRTIQSRIRHPRANNDEELIAAARDEIKMYIDGLKAERSRLYLAIQQVKSELADQDQKAPRQTKALQQITGQPTIAKAEDMELMGDAVIIAKNFTFSGTDNGVVKMTESVPVSIQKYVYHLKLYNKFSALTTTEE
ncbi:hypothetical protein EDC96DRAFT_605358 [Choanephora cucurbitarum]|nr:hypothetical protein EDC96DRAFT_605358 [Choanephora cucurbitarum]